MAMSRKHLPKNTFRERVLSIVSRIPKGKTMSYGEVASRAGSRGAARAVGTIMKSNFDPNIPCHRVILANGKLGAYNRGGTKRKRALLKEEGARVD